MNDFKFILSMIVVSVGIIVLPFISIQYINKNINDIPCIIKYKQKILNEPKYLLNTSSGGDTTTVTIYDNFLRLSVKKEITDKNIQVNCGN